MIVADLLDQVEEVRNAAVAQDIELPVHAAGMTACYDRLTGVDFTSALTLLSFGFKIGASEYLVSSVNAPGAGFVCTTIGRIFVASNATAFIRVTGGVAGDRIRLASFGYLADKPV